MFEQLQNPVCLVYLFCSMDNVPGSAAPQRRPLEPLVESSDCLLRLNINAMVLPWSSAITSMDAIEKGANDLRSQRLGSTRHAVSGKFNASPRQ